MTRPNNRRTLRLESLENREVLSGPSAQQAYMLELLNLARTNPTAAAQRFTTNLDPNVVATLNYYNVNLSAVQNAIASAPVQPPLAWNDQVAQAAQGQSQYQADNNIQSHTGANGSNLTTRFDQVGYTNTTSTGEDIYAYSTSPDEAMQAFLIDWGVPDDGHRMNIQQPNVTPDQAFKDVGVGIVNTSGSGVGPEVITVDFGSQQNEQAQLLGLAYNDLNGDNFYEVGEGQSGVTVHATNLATGATSTTQTQGAGYYALSLAPGNYQVTATEGNLLLQTQNVAIGNVNVEVDYNLTQLTPQAQTIAPPAPIVSSPPVVVAPSPIAIPTTPSTTTSSTTTSSTTTSSNPTPPSTPVTIPQAPSTVPQSSSTTTTPSTSSLLSKVFGSAFQFSWTSWSTYRVNG